MALTVLIGGVRAGKSALAVRLAAASGGPVAVLATAEPRDDEMRERIRRHRAERPDGWRTIEEPLEVRRAFEEAGEDAAVILDCLTLWASNLLEAGRSAEDIDREASAAAGAAARRRGPTLVVTNEVGMGVVPASPLGRTFRDVLGSMNRTWADAADRVLLVVAGRALPLASGEPG